MKPLFKNKSVFIFSYSKPIQNTKKWVESLPHILSILLHLVANVRERKKLELTACKMTHEQGLGGARSHHWQGGQRALVPALV